MSIKLDQSIDKLAGIPFPYTRKCQYCTKEFTTKRPETKYCSNRCRQRVFQYHLKIKKQEKEKTKWCIFCGGFVVTDPTATVCSGCQKLYKIPKDYKPLPDKEAEVERRRLIMERYQEEKKKKQKEKK